MTLISSDSSIIYLALTQQFLHKRILLTSRYETYTLGKVYNGDHLGIQAREETIKAS